MGLRDIIQAIREYPAANAGLETTQYELRQAQQALKHSEQVCKGLKLQMGEQTHYVKYLSHQSAALQAALQKFCPRLSSVEDMKEVTMEQAVFQYSRTLGYRRGPDGRPEIDPEEAETVRLIYTRYLEGRSLGDIQRELVEKNIPTAAGIQGWSRQVIQNILTSEKYIGDGLRQKTYTTGPIGNKKTVKNNGELPMYYTRDNHPAIIPRAITPE